MLINYIKTLIILLLVTTNVYSQVFKNYTVEDGLPSSEVYYSFQDSKGYIWFATDAGVSRFNGYEFESFTTEDGLTDNTIFNIKEGSKGRIWFAPFNGRFCYYKNGKIEEFKVDIEALSVINMSKFLNFYVDKKDNIWVGTERGGYKINNKGVTIISDIKKKEKNEIRINSFRVDSSQFLYALPVTEATSLNTYNINVKLGLDTIFYNDNVLISSFIEKINVNGLATFVIRKVFNSKDKIIFDNNADKELYVYDLDGNNVRRSIYDISFVAGEEILFFNYFQDHLWISLKEGGLYKCRIEKGKIYIVNHYFPSLSITSVMADDESGYWFTSLTNGVFYMPNVNVQIKGFNDIKVFQLETDTVEGKIFLNLRKGVVIYTKNGKDLIENFKNGFGSFKVYFDYVKKALVWGAVDSNNELRLKSYKKFNIEVSKRVFKYLPTFKAIEVKEDTTYAVDNEGVKIWSSDYEYYSHLDSNVQKMWCTSLIKLKEELWIGTSKGIKVYKNQKIISPFAQDENLSSAVTCIERINDSTFLIGSKNKGIIAIQNKKIKKIIDENSGLINNLVRSIHVDDRGTIWVGTSKGVSKVSYNEKGMVNIYNITKKHGLSSEEITDIKSIRDSIYIGTTKGLLVLNRNNIKKNNKAPKVYITDLKVNSQAKRKDSLQLLTYNENNISIRYLGVNYRSQGTLNYKYHLLGEGLDTSWISTTSRFVQYSLLPYGEYVYEIKAENEDGIWSKPLEVPFIISPPYWKTWWFIGFVIISFASILFWLLYTYFKRRELKLKEKAEKIELEKKMIELELKALRSQMNPHFIFNILNSIQHFMLQNNFKETNHYLTQFAKLIRTVLNLSEKNIITIGEELEMLTLYMNLEKMRFENGFDYEIILGAEIDEDYDEIPSMLIQPYIENAIWHGLMNKKSKGKIVIKIDIIDDYLFCTVNDNGIGREKAKEIKLNRKMKHKSVGMRITKDRLDLLNNETGVNVEIIDKVDDLNKPLGTEVNIKVKYVN